jgi:hypothetical protein
MEKEVVNEFTVYARAFIRVGRETAFSIDGGMSEDDSVNYVE